MNMWAVYWLLNLSILIENNAIRIDVRIEHTILRGQTWPIRVRKEKAFSLKFGLNIKNNNNKCALWLKIICTLEYNTSVWTIHIWLRSEKNLLNRWAWTNKMPVDTHKLSLYLVFFHQLPITATLPMYAWGIVSNQLFQAQNNFAFFSLDFFLFLTFSRLSLSTSMFSFTRQYLQCISLHSVRALSAIFQDIVKIHNTKIVSNFHCYACNL